MLLFVLPLHLGGPCVHTKHRLVDHLLYRCIQRVRRDVHKLQRQHHTTNRFGVQHIFYGLLFYTSELPGAVSKILNS